MKLPISVARGLVLFAWDVFAVSMDAWTCRVVGCDWEWARTSEGDVYRCARMGCRPPEAES